MQKVVEIIFKHKGEINYITVKEIIKELFKGILQQIRVQDIFNKIHKVKNRRNIR